MMSSRNRTTAEKCGECGRPLRSQVFCPDCEVQMRAMAGLILLISPILAASSAQAQTYDPRYPVCMQVYTIDGPAIGCGLC